jgi:hypothetical protein
VKKFFSILKMKLSYRQILIFTLISASEILAVFHTWNDRLQGQIGSKAIQAKLNSLSIGELKKIIEMAKAFELHKKQEEDKREKEKMKKKQEEMQRQRKVQDYIMARFGDTSVFNDFFSNRI